MMNCRLCKFPIDDRRSIELTVPAGTQLFSDDATTAQSLRTQISIVECASCALLQLVGEPVAYEYVSSSSSFVSGQLTEHRIEQLRELYKMRSALAGKGRLLEIGCGDGHLLGHSTHLFEHSVGVEPTKRNAQSAAARGLDVHQMFMSKDAKVPGAPFDYFCSFHVLEHVTDVCSVLRGIATALTDDAVGVVEVPSTEAAIEHKRYGDFMPDHLNYFTESTLRIALEWNGFVVERTHRDWGGEHLVAYVRKRPKVSSLNYIVDRQKKLGELVVAVNSRKIPFAVWGVSHHLLPYIPTLTGISSFIAVDGSSSKIGKFIPSTAIPVRPKSALREIPHCYVALTAPRFKDEIMGELSEMYESAVEDAQLSACLGFSVYECRAGSAPSAGV